MKYYIFRTLTRGYKVNQASLNNKRTPTIARGRNKTETILTNYSGESLFQRSLLYARM